MILVLAQISARMSTTDSESQLDVGQVIIRPIVTVTVMCIVYGFYIALFSHCMQLLRHGGLSRRSRYLWSTVTLFVASTGMVAVEITKVLHDSVVEFTSAKTQDLQPFYNLLKHDAVRRVIYAFAYTLPIIANVAADFILIHRCYTVWGAKKRILIPMIVTSFAVTMISSTGLIMSIIGFRDTTIKSNMALFNNGGNIQAIGWIMSAIFNFALTLLTGGRIWWITRCVGPPRNYLVTTMNKIIFESGVLYPLVMIVHLSIDNAFPENQVPIDTYPLIVLAAGIAPTLIIVRIRLGISTHDGDTMTQPPRSSQFMTSFQLTERSLYLSRPSTVTRPRPAIEVNQVKTPPRTLQAVQEV
ncbi:hypothetical protein E1B28_009170 [Marasmius oreades]|uniref:Uncharacterized protein n=1 Tax=Marasmius oreades TaxID=181124 RepID=A0A9P7UT45_9AGAR|nr:uncharacterized protein E1B28_009170 [Marasmius oreades]KAG7092855.1 hypothetical protein E1B28_009170 [Marasmius oreades]